MKETFTLRRDERILGRLTKPRGSQVSDVGLLIWGMGIAELRLAKQFAEIGWPSLQLTLREPKFLRSHGIELCQNAMTELEDRFSIDQFVWVGNCSNASVCMNTALVDNRAVGLVMTNPAIIKSHLLGDFYRTKLLSWQAWRKLLAGRANFRKHIENVQMLKDSFKEEISNSSGPTGKASVASGRHHVMPRSLRKKLRELSNNSVRMLVVCSEGDSSLARLQSIFGEDLKRFLSLPNCSFDLLPKAPHIISRDGNAASTLNEKILNWVANVSFESRTQHFPGEIEPEVSV